MDAFVAVSLAGTGIVSLSAAGGVIYSIIRNGRTQNRKDTELKTMLKSEIANIKDKLDDPNEGLGAIKKEMKSIQLNCASVTSGFKARIDGLEEDVKDVKKKRR